MNRRHQRGKIKLEAILKRLAHSHKLDAKTIAEKPESILEKTEENFSKSEAGNPPALSAGARRCTSVETRAQQGRRLSACVCKWCGYPIGSERRCGTYDKHRLVCDVVREYERHQRERDRQRREVRKLSKKLKKVDCRDLVEIK